MKINLRTNKGFTVVELLVSITVFSVIIAIASTSFVRALRSQRAIVSLIAINDNASLTLEQMAREIRTGTDFQSVDSESLEFISARGQAISYQLNDGKIERREDNGLFLPITATNVYVDRLGFRVVKQDEGSTLEIPRITIVMRVGSKARDVDQVFTNLQTTVAPLVLNQ